MSTDLHIILTAIKILLYIPANITMKISAVSGAFLLQKIYSSQKRFILAKKFYSSKKNLCLDISSCLLYIHLNPSVLTHLIHLICRIRK